MESFILGTLMFITAVFLILLVLVQRGRGGGLAGALGGAGGQSAFGAKAGDVFTRITIGVAAFWIILCVFTVARVGGASKDQLNVGGVGGTKGSTTIESNLDPDAEAPASSSKPSESSSKPEE